jgi:hypothetical protein
MRWAISTFKPFKLARADGIVPALLQQGVYYVTTYLCHIATARPACENTPKAWRQVKVTFILKPGKANYTEANAYCPISLSPFMMKKMEKLKERHIRDEVLGIRALR